MYPRVGARVIAALCSLVFVTIYLSADSPAESMPDAFVPQRPASAPALAGDPEIFVGAGDIATCPGTGDEAVATVLDGIAGTVYTTGDNVYPDGTAGQFTTCYEPSWGRHKARTRPSPGNHDYNTTGATGYYGYFGANAGPSGQGYYSYDIGAWHAVSLNSNCSRIGGCGATSAQATWLQADLAANPSVCTIAYWHHPILTIGPHNNDEEGILALWQILYDNDVDVVLVGHDHNYQRYATLNRDHNGVDAQNGIRYFVVGTGGNGLTSASSSRANATPGIEVWADDPNDGDGHSASLGVLKLSLYEEAYEFEFVPVAGGTFTDSGSGTCHPAPDTDADGVPNAQDNCPSWPNPGQQSPSWTVPADDADCDGFDAVHEAAIGTDPATHCAATPDPGDEEPDSWPTDSDDNGATLLGDIIRFGPSYNHSRPDPAYNPRFDLNTNDALNLSDIVLTGPYYNRSCS